MAGWGSHFIFDYPKQDSQTTNVASLLWTDHDPSSHSLRNSAQQKYTLERDPERDLEKILRIWPLKMKKYIFQ